MDLAVILDGFTMWRAAQLFLGFLLLFVLFAPLPNDVEARSGVGCVRDGVCHKIRLASCTPVTATLNPADKAADITLSGGNLTASLSTGFGDEMARSTLSFASGKKYFEFTTSNGTPVHMGVGFATSGQTLATYLGNGTGSWGFFANGLFDLNNVQTTLDGTNNPLGDTYGVAWDIGNNLVWVTHDGITWNSSLAGTQNPVTGQGGVSTVGIDPGPYFPAISEGNDGANDSMTVNYGATSFSYIVPSGFSTPAIPCGSPPPITQFFVATNGNDANPGTFSAPFLTLGHCQAAMRNSPAKICTLRGGTYTLGAALAFTSLDNGEIWQAFNGDPVNSEIVDGGNSLSCPVGYSNGGDPNQITWTGITFSNFTSFVNTTGGHVTCGVGPRGSTGPVASITCPGGAVNIAAGSNIQAVVNGHGPGTSYCLQAGTFTNQSVVPQAGDTYTCQFGTTLDGTNTTAHVFYASSGALTNVTIRNCKIQNYTASHGPGQGQDAPINNRDNSANGWVIDHNEILNSAAWALEVGGNGSTASFNNLHNNGQGGIACGDNSNITVTDNAMANNNLADGFDVGFEAGGLKCTNLISSTVQFNIVTGNFGPGLWFDINCDGVTIQNNDVETNQGPGIFYEISWSGLIQNNLAKNNGSTTLNNCPGWLWCGQILVAASGATSGTVMTTLTVSGNTIVTPAPSLHGNAITEIQQTRNEASTHGTHLVQNVKVSGNSVDVTAGTGNGFGGNGAVTDNGTFSMFTTAGNTWDTDSYLGANGNTFWWGNSTSEFTESFAAWQGQGNDTHGSCGPSC